MASGDIPRTTRKLPRGPSDIPRMKLDFEAMIEDAPGGREFTAQTPNGTAHWRGQGWNKGSDYEAPQVAPDLTRPAGRSNRTGE